RQPALFYDDLSIHLWQMKSAMHAPSIIVVTLVLARHLEAIFSRAARPLSPPPPQSLSTAAAWLGYSPLELFRAGLRPRVPGQPAVTPRPPPGAALLVRLR